MKLSEISYPVYLLGDVTVETENSQKTIIKTRKISDEYKEFKYFVDDTSIPGTFSQRRLRLLGLGVTLYPLKISIYFLADLIKLANPKNKFIDSEGKIFIYKKSKFAPIIFLPIDKILAISTGGAVITVEGLSERFKVLFMPDKSIRYASLLRIDGGYILYGLHEKIENMKRRKI